ncbi:MAG TPA: glycosyltransferase [Blastocatellia bacterium]|nr:glycosyltransferase [Blastocatellia bacterium]
MKISVLICTRNRAASLRETLKAVFALAPPAGYEYEVVVIDNGSTDGTRVVIAELIAGLPLHQDKRLRYGYEPMPGLSHARNAALRIAQGDVLVFIDDDIWPEASWLNEIYQEFAADPQLCLLGGRVLLAQAHLQPVGIVTGEQRQTLTTPDGAAMVIGANFAFRRSVVEQIGGFDPRLGAGGLFAAGEDVDFVYRAMKAGHKLVYAPQALVYHNHDRVSHEQACKLEFNYGHGSVAYFVKHILKGDLFAVKVTYWSLHRALRQAMGRAAVSREMVERTRSYLRGFAKGLFPALVRMW